MQTEFSSETIKTMVRLKPGESIWKANANHLLCDKGTFYFDKIFENETNHDIFNHCWDLMKVVLQGINTSCFTYGQTSSGKTYTLLGTESDPGLLPLTLQQLFKINGLSIKISYIEVYNEFLKDLLEPENIPKLQTSNNHVTISNLLQATVETYEQAMHYLKIGEQSRKYGYTDINEHSSRSHALFQIHIQRQQEDRTTFGLLTLVDLAGSERIKHTNAEGARLKEGQMINKSLLALGSVIQKLSEKQAHIPFRDSKLTRILQNSLGGNSRTIAICCISPELDHIDESISTLKFALKTMRIENKPLINESSSEEQLLRRYEFKINQLESKLENQQDSFDFADQLECYKQQELLLKQRIFELEQAAPSDVPMKRRHSIDHQPLKRIKRNEHFYLIPTRQTTQHHTLLHQHVKLSHFNKQFKHHHLDFKHAQPMPAPTPRVVNPISPIVKQHILHGHMIKLYAKGLCHAPPIYKAQLPSHQPKHPNIQSTVHFSHFKACYQLCLFLQNTSLAKKQPNLPKLSPPNQSKSITIQYKQPLYAILLLKHLVKPPLHTMLPIHITNTRSCFLHHITIQDTLDPLLKTMLLPLYKHKQLLQCVASPAIAKQPLSLTTNTSNTIQSLKTMLTQCSVAYTSLNRKLELYLSMIHTLEASKLAYGNQLIGQEHIKKELIHLKKTTTANTTVWVTALNGLKHKISAVVDLTMPLSIIPPEPDIQTFGTYDLYSTMGSELVDVYLNEKMEIKKMLQCIKQEYMAHKQAKINMAKELEKSTKTVGYLKDKLMLKMSDRKEFVNKEKEMEMEINQLKRSLKEAQARIIMMDSKHKQTEHERNSVGRMYKELKQKTMHAQEYLQKQAYSNEDPNKTINELNENCNVQ